ncbi:N(2)-fixation sustaining protein CowN [Rhodocyclus tenuis]|uniref:N(2)-fixation sustaining protein CowN n=2 Tax=Rhodocyclus TaxID=1064 RepID=A0A6L5JU31_RHOTE|nr:N(2)-fixation sustaining protein CowN [Rhodocyclus gracilis]MQY50867.1 N(2)-fixation sustaining protein CowN [Rhodocyclus gracilis]MRD72841.1 N(2)-fixation sustaining protein CowN [Rhodocyclus gracilis]NJA90046.1 N(2)-fixation sustaining protein CowN [Rhodocyclus gracilis]
MTEETRDRYVSFSNIDCDARARQLVGLIRVHAERPENGNPFWDYFLKRLNSGKHDELFMLHCYLQGLRDALEGVGDEHALSLLGQIEEECM